MNDRLSTPTEKLHRGGLADADAASRLPARPTRKVQQSAECFAGRNGSIAYTSTMPCEVTIRDGRIDRDPTQVDENGHGAVLGTVLVDQPPDIGDVIALQDGTRVMVIGAEQQLSSDAWKMTVHVGNLPDPT